MAQLHPHLLFKGNTEEAFGFYASVFGGNYEVLLRMKDMPNPTGRELSESEGNKIIHIVLPIGKLGQLMGSDVAEQYSDEELVTGNRYTIAIQADSKEEAEQLYQGLSAGGVVEMPLEESPWNTYFGMFADKYGIQWMLEFNPKRV
jgi:PhnB protein